MKKHLMLILAIAVLLLAGCQNQQLADNNLPAKDADNSNNTQPTNTINSSSNNQQNDTEITYTEIYNDSYIEAKNIELSSSLVSSLIDNDWSIDFVSKTFGEKSETVFTNSDLVAGGDDSYFNYYLNKSIGFLYKASNNKQIDCILIDKSFSINKLDSKFNNVIDIASQIKDVKATLGEPCFIEEELNIIGYKLVNYYIFFRGSENVEQIAIYPKIKYDKSLLNDALKAISESNSYKIWQNYDYLAGESTLGYKEYKTNGLRIIQYYPPSSTDESVSLDQFQIYGNYFETADDKLIVPSNIPILKEDALFSCGKWGVCLSLDKDFVFEHEKERVISLIDFKDRFLNKDNLNKAEYQVLNNGTDSSISPNEKLAFVALLPTYRMRIYRSDFSELLTELYGVDNYAWLNERYVVYDKDLYFIKPRVKAIVIYDCLIKKEFIVINTSSSVDYNLKSVTDTAFTYTVSENGTNKDIIVNFSFNDNGDIMINK